MTTPPHLPSRIASGALRAGATLWRLARAVRLPQSRGGRVVLSLAVVYFVWGSTYLGVKVALDSFPPLLLSGLRNLLAGVGLFVFAMRRRPVMPTLLEVRNAGVVGTLLVGLSSGMLAYGMRTVGTGTAAVMVATVPLFATVISAVSGRRVAKAEWAAVALGLVGIAILSHGGGNSGSAGGSLAILCGALFWAIGAHLAGRLALPADLFIATALQIGLGGAISTAVAWLSGERMTSLHFLPLTAFLYLLFVGTMAAYVAYGYLIRYTSPLVASSCMYVNPVVAVALGALMLGEPVTRGTIVATVLILGSVGLSFLFDDRRRVS
ncbi:EamA family transporter [Paraburkholderia lycopersici]|uniref:Permease of the drug/metabolite transporter (DMT) superfamily n=1 Tax=Paraburkholderia lycopersici TaxID=416944 RepID=A0A1G6I6K0_9BURK|nr:EamA family transporter [Paraburkholderia lycopersici]SDC02179.1 Permease of the drug/metabolite transporter (DMT) superfamily [Paraburkholderia lycopersici]